MADDELDTAALQELVRELQEQLQTLQGRVLALQARHQQQRDDHQQELQEVEQRLQEALQSSRREETSYLQTLLMFAEQERDAAREVLRAPPAAGCNAENRPPPASPLLPARYRQAVEALETELQQEAERCKAWRLRCSQLQRLCRASDERLEKSETARLNTESRLRLQVTELQSRNDELQQLQASHQHEYELQTRDLQQLQQQMQQLRERESELQAAVAGAGDKLREGERKVLEGVRVAKDAIEEKDAALLREGHLKKEVEELRSEVERMMSTATEKSKEQINKSKDEYNRTIQKISQDLAQTKQDYERAQAEKELLAESLQEVRAAEATDRAGLQEELQQQRLEAAELRQRIADLTALSSSSVAREEAARDREERLRQLFCEQASKQESQLQHLTEQLAAARADSEQARVKLRAAERNLEAEKTYAGDRRKADNNKIEKLEQLLDEKKKQREELERQHQQRLQHLRSDHEQTVARLHDLVEEKQETCTRLLQEGESMRRALEVRLAAVQAQASSTAGLLAEQKAHTAHYRKKLETASARLEECQKQLEEIENRNFDRI